MLRVGDYGIVFKIADKEVCIIGILHRKWMFNAFAKKSAMVLYLFWIIASGCFWRDRMDA